MGEYASYIIAAYVLASVVLAGVTVSSLLSYRRAKALDRQS